VVPVVKQGGPLKRTAMKPRKKGLPRESAKRRATFPDRQKAMEMVRARDKVCQFWPRYYAWCALHPNEHFPAPVHPCFGELHGHEPRKLSHYPEDYTDPERIVLLCDYHNGGWVEDYPIERKLLGL
jgi:hypothetical protein